MPTLARVSLEIVRVIAKVTTAVCAVNVAFWLSSLYPSDPVGVQIAVIVLVTLWIVVSDVARHAHRESGAASYVGPLGIARAVTVEPVSRVVAEHEAAHAVVGHVMGMEGIEAHMAPTDGLVASVQGGYPNRMPLQDSEWGALVCTVAGQVYDHAHGVRDSCSRSDMKFAVEHCLAIASIGLAPTGYAGPLAVDSLCAAARDAAARILQEHDGLVQSVAEALTAGGYFGPEQMRVLLTAGPASRPARNPPPSSTRSWEPSSGPSRPRQAGSPADMGPHIRAVDPRPERQGRRVRGCCPAPGRRIRAVDGRP